LPFFDTKNIYDILTARRRTLVDKFNDTPTFKAPDTEQKSSRE